MPFDANGPLTPADPKELADAIAFALIYERGKRKHDARPIMADIVAARLVRQLDQAGFVIMRKPPLAPHGMGFGAPPREK